MESVINDFAVIGRQTSRNMKLFLKDKMNVFFSMLAPFIVLLLYVLFIGEMQIDGMTESMKNMGIATDEKAVRTFCDTWMIAGVLTVACITVSFSTNSVMIHDKEQGVNLDFMAAPVKQPLIYISYFLSNLIITACIVMITFAVCLIYLAASNEFMMSAAQVFASIGIIVLGSLSAATISAVVMYFIKTEAAHGAIVGIMSAAVGFLIGAFMPLSTFPKGVQWVSALLPGNHIGGLFRNQIMDGALNKLAEGAPIDFVNGLREEFAFEVEFFGIKANQNIMLAYVFAIIALFIVLNILLALRKTNKQSVMVKIKKKKTN